MPYHIDSYFTDKDCPTCNGSGCGEIFFNKGVMDIDMNPCPDCMGSGKVIDWAEYWSEYDDRYDIL